LPHLAVYGKVAPATQNQALRLRVHDIDFSMKQLTVRGGKGDKERLTTFSVSTIPFLQNQLEKDRLLQRRPGGGQPAG
jgi:site-specific recombinase XerD